jgi:hypothetical protein
MQEQPWAAPPGSAVPGLIGQGSSMPMPAPPEPDPPLQQFLNHVVRDGRFLDTVTQDPRTVADALGIELSAETEAELKARPLKDHLNEFYARARVGPIAIVGVAILLGIVVVVALKYSTKGLTEMERPVRDNSARAHLKL